MRVGVASRGPAQLCFLLFSSIGLSLFILFGHIEAAPRIWVGLAIIGPTLLVGWHLSQTGSLSLRTLDRFAWALLICHTVIIHTPRDIRILADDPSASLEIQLQVAVWIVCISYATARLAGNPRYLRNLFGPGAKYTAMFFLVALLSSIYAIGPMITLAWCLKLLTILLLCCLLFDPLDAAGSCDGFINATFIGLALMVIQFLLIGLVSPASAIDMSSTTGIWRAGGDIIASTQLSTIAGMVCVLALIDIFTKGARSFYMLAFTISGAVMFAALGRGGILAATAAALVVLASLRRLRLAVAITTAISLTMIMWPTLQSLAWDILTRKQRSSEFWSLTGRIPVWQTSIDLFSEKPLLGWGYVSGSRIGLLTPSNGWVAAGAHNALLEILLALGIVGAALLFGLLWKTYRITVTFLLHRWTTTSPTPEALCAMKVLVLLICLTFEGFFEGSFSGPPRFETTLFMGSVFCADQFRKLMRPGR